jgi:hypothetical protein
MGAGMEKDVSTRPLASGWTFCAFGAAAALVAAVLAGVLRSPLYALWIRQLGAASRRESDYLSFAPTMMVFDPLLLLPPLVVLVPFLYADHRRVNDRTPMVGWRITLLAMPWIALYGVFMAALTYNVLKWLVFAGPGILLAVLAVLRLTQIANRELTRDNRGAGEA